MLQVWQPNTIPLPYPAAQVFQQAQTNATSGSASIAQVETALPVTVDMNDLFPKAQVSKYFQFQRYGFIMDARGKEIFFNLQELDFVGAKGKEDLKVGAHVGYDVSWTSSGLHVKKLKIY